MHTVSKKSMMIAGIVVVVGVIVSLVGVVFQSVETHMQRAQVPLAGELILIDPGHGGVDGGAVSKQGLVEKEVTLKIALLLRDYLQQSGAYVSLTREADQDLAGEQSTKISKRKAQDLIKRVHMIKEKQAATVISIHLNAFPQTRYTGGQTFYHPKLKANKRLASCIQHALIQNLSNTKRIPKQKGNVYLLNQSPVPTALVEVGFLSNPQEAALLATDAYQQKIAAAIYYGLIQYYSKETEPIFPS